jgi:hypothetical protein
MRHKFLSLVTAFGLIPALLLAQGLPIKSGTTSDLASVDTNKNVRTALGASTRPTYIASAGGLATTALYNMSIESSASLGYKLAKVCIGVSVMTTPSAPVAVTIQRRTTASSAGTLATAEGTATPAVSKMDLGDANFGGIVRITSTLGTAGAVLDSWGFVPGEVGAGAADPPSLPVFCKSYGDLGDKMPTVPAGTANGISINVGTFGAGGLASGSIAATLIAE